MRAVVVVLVEIEVSGHSKKMMVREWEGVVVKDEIKLLLAHNGGVAGEVDVEESENVTCDFMSYCHEQGMACERRIKGVTRDIRVKVREVAVIDGDGDASFVKMRIQGDVAWVVGEKKGTGGRVEGSEAAIVECS